MEPTKKKTEYYELPPGLKAAIAQVLDHPAMTVNLTYIDPMDLIPDFSKWEPWPESADDRETFI